MKRRWLAFVLLWAAPSIGADETVPVRLETMKGTTIAGTIAIRSLKVQSDLGPLEMPIAKVEMIEVRQGMGAPRYYIIHTTSKDDIAGTIVGPERLEIAFDLGSAQMHWAELRTLTLRPSRVKPDGGGGLR